MRTGTRVLGTAVMLAATLVLAAPAARAEVTIETVHVGNTGNAGEWSGESYGGYGPDRICGAVDYAYNIGKFEVTAGQYTDFLNKVAGVDTYYLYHPSMWSDDLFSLGCKVERYAGSGTSGDPYQYRVAADRANRPVNYVNWGVAARFANWLHNGQKSGLQDLSTTEDGSYYLNGAMSGVDLIAVTREADATWAIPTEDEWYKAAYHKNDGVTGNYFDYPTGSDTTPSNDLIDPDPGNNATFRESGYTDTIGSPYWRTEVGEHENSDSPYGTFDQGGNVREWNESQWKETSRVGHGGEFLGSDGYLHASYRAGLYPTYTERDTGFRVSEVPEPASAALLLMGGLAVLVRNRRR